MLAGSKMRFDEGGRQYEAEEEVFLAGGTTLPSGRAVTHSGGGLAANSAANNHTGTVTLTSGGSSYVLTRMIFDAGGRTVATLADNAAQTTFGYDGADRQTQASPTPWATSSPTSSTPPGTSSARPARRSVRSRAWPRRRPSPRPCSTTA